MTAADEKGLLFHLQHSLQIMFFFLVVESYFVGTTILTLKTTQYLLSSILCTQAISQSMITSRYLLVLSRNRTARVTTRRPLRTGIFSAFNSLTIDAKTKNYSSLVKRDYFGYNVKIRIYGNKFEPLPTLWYNATYFAGRNRSK